MGDIAERLRELGLPLPPVPKAAGSYSPIKLIGQRFITSGMLPIREGAVLTGRGGVASLDELRAAAQQSILNLLALLHDRIGSAAIIHIDHLRGFIAADAGFTEGHLVLNAASDLLIEVLGAEAIHTREAVHVSGLPLGAAVELSLRGRWG